MEQLIKILEELKPGVNFREEYDLLEKGLLDSITIIEMIPMIEDAFGIEVGMENFAPENFASAETIWNMIQRSKG